MKKLNQSKFTDKTVISLLSKTVSSSKKAIMKDSIIIWIVQQQAEARSKVDKDNSDKIAQATISNIMLGQRLMSFKESWKICRKDLTSKQLNSKVLKPKSK